VEALDVDDVIAGLLVTEGFTSIEDLLGVEDEELAEIEGFDESVAQELKRRAQAFLDQKDVELDEKRIAMGVEDAVAEAGGFSPAMLVALGEKGVKTLDDLADLAADELIEILGAEAINEDTANDVIMAARAHWFDDADGEAGEPAAEDDNASA
jgi:N utilization substance protein A